MSCMHIRCQSATAPAHGRRVLSAPGRKARQGKEIDAGGATGRRNPVHGGRAASLPPVWQRLSDFEAAFDSVPDLPATSRSLCLVDDGTISDGGSHSGRVFGPPPSIP